MVGQKVVFICLVTFAVGVSADRRDCQVMEEQNFDIKTCTSAREEVDKVEGTWCPMWIPMPERICKEVEYCYVETHCEKSTKVEYRVFPAPNDGKKTCRTHVAHCENEAVTKSKKERCNF